MVSGSRRGISAGGLILALIMTAAMISTGARAQMPNGWSYTPHSVARTPPSATARCRDGRWSHLSDRRRACRGHGGVAQWL